MRMRYNNTDQYQIVLESINPDEVIALPPSVSLLGWLTVLDTAPDRASAYIKVLKWAERTKRKPILADTVEMIQQKGREKREAAKRKRLGLDDE